MLFLRSQSLAIIFPHSKVSCIPPFVQFLDHGEDREGSSPHTDGQCLGWSNLAILIISHSLDQVFRLSDRICVLRRGQQIGVRKTSETDKNEIVSMITGVSGQAA